MYIFKKKNIDESLIFEVMLSGDNSTNNCDCTNYGCGNNVPC